jgi:hypothetical protein
VNHIASPNKALLVQLFAKAFSPKRTINGLLDFFPHGIFPKE